MSEQPKSFDEWWRLTFRGAPVFVNQDARMAANLMWERAQQIERATLAAENARLREEDGNLRSRLEDSFTRELTLQIENARLRERVAEFRQYVMHRRDCNCALPADDRRGDACDCGLAALLAGDAKS